MKFSKGYQSKEERASSRAPLPDGYWCVECHASGFVPATVVSRSGRVNDASVACHCEAGMRYAPRSLMSYSAAVKAEVLSATAKTKSQHWLHAKLRFFELTGDTIRLEELRAMIASGDPAMWLREKWRTTPPAGPLANTTRKAVGK
jgi:hypothetical protein